MRFCLLAGLVGPLLILSPKILAQPANDPASTQILFAATTRHPRYTEGSIVELDNGELLAAVTEFVDSGSDFAHARIVARRSVDGGDTWSSPTVLQERTGKVNVMSVTLRRLQPPLERTIVMFYLQKNGFDDLRVYVRHSTDEGHTFGDPILVTDAPGYHVLNNDRVTQLSGGRLLVPVASTRNVKTVNHFTSRCWISDDGGQSWRGGKGALDLPKRGAMEPEVIELTDGRILMIARTQLGYIASSYSTDRGDTWSKASPLGDLPAPEAPATIRRIPSTGHLLLIWNDTYQAGNNHGGRRTPLAAAVSRDEGRSWQRVGNIESDAARTFAYTSVLFAQDRVHMTYWDESNRRYSTRYRSLPVGWFYRSRQ